MRTGSCVWEYQIQSWVQKVQIKIQGKVSVEWGLVAIAHNLRKYITQKLKRADDVANIKENSLTIVLNRAT